MSIQPEPEHPTESSSAAPNGWTVAGALLKEAVETIVLTLIIAFLIQLVIRNFKVDGHSMEPNLQHGQYLVVDKISYHLPFKLKPPQRGDVIVFAPPVQSPPGDFVKRIIGLPGDTVELKDGEVYINNQLWPNTFGAALDHAFTPPVQVPAETLFVLGDNRADSSDSRAWGILKMENVVGKAWLSYWPPQRWGLIPNNAPATSATLNSLWQGNTETP